MLRNEMEQEAHTTRKMLSRVPADKLGWQPHPKSMTMSQLAVHIAELPGWAAMALRTDGLDFAEQPYEQPPVSTTADLLALFEKSLAEGRDALANVTDADLKPTWTLRAGDTIYSSDTKGDVVRACISQTIHHRAQLGVYLRLLNIPIPGSYGPSADEPGNW